MRVLLDTNAFLWAASQPSRLSGPARAAIEESANQRFLSPVTPWELGIKLNSGKLHLVGDLPAFIAKHLHEMLLTELPIRMEHAIATTALPPIHRDPFDRMLVAQAIVERVPIVTSDSHLARYGVEVIW
ncbi:MAG: PIN domain nuclease [Anaerolinea sp.]|nr:PIN domain nuclease [Anaerolinea sp.]